MPHVVIQYTPNLEPAVDVQALCSAVAASLIAQQDETGKQAYPTGGTRVLAYPASHFAVADGLADCGFCYINVRIAPGRSEVTKIRNSSPALRPNSTQARRLACRSDIFPSAIRR